MWKLSMVSALDLLLLIVLQLKAKVLDAAYGHYLCEI